MNNRIEPIAGLNINDFKPMTKGKAVERLKHIIHLYIQWGEEAGRSNKNAEAYYEIHIAALIWILKFLEGEGPTVSSIHTNIKDDVLLSTLDGIIGDFRGIVASKQADEGLNKRFNHFIKVLEEAKHRLSLTM